MINSYVTGFVVSSKHDSSTLYHVVGERADIDGVFRSMSMNSPRTLRSPSRRGTTSELINASLGTSDMCCSSNDDPPQRQSKPLPSIRQVECHVEAYSCDPFETMASAIRAWTFTNEGYPEALHKSALKAPSSPSPTEFHVRIKAAALNPVDIQLINLPVWRYLPEFLAPPAKGISEDFAGVVESAGKSSGFKPGDEVGVLLLVMFVLFQFASGSSPKTIG